MTTSQLATVQALVEALEEAAKPWDGPNIQAALAVGHAFLAQMQQEAQSAPTAPGFTMHPADKAELNRIYNEAAAASAPQALTDEEIAEVAAQMEASDPTASFWRNFARAALSRAQSKSDEIRRQAFQAGVEWERRMRSKSDEIPK